MHVDACRANRVTGSQSDALFERRMSCLDRRLGELGETAGLLDGAPDVATVDRALVAAHELPPLAPCADGESLMAALPLPDDPARRQAGDAADAASTAADHDRQWGRLDGLAARAPATVDAA